MKILLTDIEVAKAYYEAVRDKNARLSDKRRAIAKAQLKKVMEYLKERATFMEWEWEDSKGIWDIVLDDIAWQALLKEAGIEVCPKCGKDPHPCKCPTINRGSFAHYLEE